MWYRCEPFCLAVIEVVFVGLLVKDGSLKMCGRIEKLKTQTLCSLPLQGSW
jgi:hypothetical protein